MKKATQQQTKEHNRNLALSTIFKHEAISRAEIARQTGLTRTTVSDIVADFIEAGLVGEVGIGPSIGGKSPILLSLLEDARGMVGLDLANNQFVGGIVNLRGKIRQMVALPVHDRNGEDALELVYEILDRLIEECSIPLVGIGVGTPGLVNASEGVVVNAVNLDWKDLPLAELLRDRYRLPTRVLNDSQAAAIGEFTYTTGFSPESSLVVINVRHGIGGGIIVHGNLFQGDGGSAGEIGHIVVVPEGGLPCRCGSRGCLETVASARALVKRVRQLAPQSTSQFLANSTQAIDLEAIQSAFEAGDPIANQAVLETARYLGLAIASLAGTLNIHQVVLVGDMTRFGERWLQVIERTLAENSMPRLAQETTVKISSVGVDGVLLGASAILMSDFTLLFNPIQVEKQQSIIS